MNAPQRYVQIAVKACHECFTSYDLNEWAALPLVRDYEEACKHGGAKCGQPHRMQERRCQGTGESGDTCDVTLRLDMTATERIETEVTAEEFAQIYPDSPRRFAAYEKHRQVSFRERAFPVLVALVVLAALAHIARLLGVG